MVAATAAAARSVDSGVAPDPGTQRLSVLLAHGGVAEVDDGDGDDDVRE